MKLINLYLILTNYMSIANKIPDLLFPLDLKKKSTIPLSLGTF